MNRFAITLLLGVLFVPPVVHARECPAPPVRSSGQAVCYATVYAQKNGLSHGPAFKQKTTRGKSAWTVTFVDTRRNAPSKGWQVDVDAASGMVTRFTAHKKPERSAQ
jgi:hypothetical protein